MRNSWTRWLSAVVVLLCCASSAYAAQRTTRVFAMQPKLDLAWMDSRADFHDKLFALADKTMRGDGKPLIQTAADDMASHLRPDGRNLVVWPEDLGLWTAFVGQRGADARASGSLVGAILSLFTSYAPQVTYYAGRYPAVAARTPQVRLLALALTDTFGRTAVETYSEMAAKYHVWLEAGVDMTQSWHVVCLTDEHPPQEPCDEQNPAKVAALGDPEDMARGYAYEATSPDVSNMALLFAPDGRLYSKQVKTYITPIEVGQAEGQVAALDLVPGSIAAGLTAEDTPVGTLGFVTSKDAWMPDVVDRLEEGGVQLLLQPEFFEGDLATTSGMWAADTLKAAGYSDVQRHPGFSAMALSSAVGNVFDFSADEQSQIAVRDANAKPAKSLIGQAPAAGLVAVAPWAAPDPLTPTETIAQRRARLGEVGKKLAPGSGVACPDPSQPGPCENGNAETVLWKDVPVGWPSFHRTSKRRRTIFAAAHPLDRSNHAERNAAVAFAGRYAAVAYERQASFRSQLMVASSGDRGRHWTRARAVAPIPGGQQWPAIAIDRRGRITVAFGSSPRIGGLIPQIEVSWGHAGRTKFTHPIPVSQSANDRGQWKPALATDARGVVHIAFVAARTRSADGNLPQAGIYYGHFDGTFVQGKLPVKRLDDHKPDPLAAKLDNAWAPSITVSGKRVLVTWTDFQHYDWDVMSRLSTDGGATFGDQVDSNLDKPDVEDLSDSPKALFTKGGPLIAWTDFHKRDSAKAPHPLYDTYLAAPGKPPVQVDPYGAKQVSTYWPAACADGKDAIVAFQDSAASARIRITRVRGGMKRGRALALSDSPRAAYRPTIACSGGRFVAAWEDTRDGPPAVFVAQGALRQLR